MRQDVLVMVLAGGEGSRLRPLTNDRAKPAVPFGGRYRMIDLVLSNFVNSGFYHINVLTQYKSDSLNRHISRAWHLSSQVGHYVEVVPAQQRTGKHWYMGSADAIFQNLNLIRDVHPEHVCVFGSDHIYKMDVSQLMTFHRQKRAALTIAAIPMPLEQAHQFGVIHVDEDWRVVGFQEKPKTPTPIPSMPTHALVSMGNYVFRRAALVEQIERDAGDSKSAHDFGRSILTSMVASQSQHVYAYDFFQNIIPGQPENERGYWRDVGTVDAFWNASMDLVAVVPEFDLYNRRWPIRTFHDQLPPAKFVHDDPISGRTGMAINSLVSEGCIVSGGVLRNSVLSPQTRVNSFAVIEESVIFDRTEIGRRARIRRAILDKDVTVSPDAVIGYNLEEDKKRFYVSPEGIVVVPKGTTV